MTEIIYVENYSEAERIARDFPSIKRARDIFFVDFHNRDRIMGIELPSKRFPYIFVTHALNTEMPGFIESRFRKQPAANIDNARLEAERNALREAVEYAKQKIHITYMDENEEYRCALCDSLTYKRMDNTWLSGVLKKINQALKLGEIK